VAGWATYGQYRDVPAQGEPSTTRAYTLTFFAPAPPKPLHVPLPRPVRARVRHEASQPTAPVATNPSYGRGEQQPGSTAADPEAITGTQPAGSALQVRELAPGVTVAAIPDIAPPTEPAPDNGPPVPRGVYQAATLVTPAGSACPELPVPPEWYGREVSVAVAFVVDTSGRVDPSRIQTVESPGRQSTGRRFYPRIYVVGTKAGPARGGVNPASFDSLVTLAVTTHIAALRFRPALVGGRPVGSTVLVACHHSPGA
jgi:hypothetical protein